MASRRQPARSITDAAHRRRTHIVKQQPLCRFDEAATVLAQDDCRRPLLRAFVQRGLIDVPDAKEMNEHDHGGGFSLDASVHIDGDDRSGLERFAPLRPATVCHGAAAPARPKSAAVPLSHTATRKQCADLLLTPLELIDTIAAWVAPPRKHRRRYFGALVPKCPQRNPHRGCPWRFWRDQQDARRGCGRGSRVIGAQRLARLESRVPTKQIARLSWYVRQRIHYLTAALLLERRSSTMGMGAAPITDHARAVHKEDGRWPPDL